MALNKKIRETILEEWRELNQAYGEPLIPPEGRQVSEILNQLWRKLGLEEKVGQNAIAEKWPQIVGSTLALHCHPQQLKDGKLLVIVTNSVWYHELERVYKNQILERVQKIFGKAAIKQILFRVG